MTASRTSASANPGAPGLRKLTALSLAGVFAALALPLSLVSSTPADGAGTETEGIEGDVEHGLYLVEHVAMCIECHSPRDQHGEILESRKLLGAPIPIGPPPWKGEWATLAPRILGLPGYDDRKALRLLTQGAIGRDEQPLKPPMPPFRMTRQDAADVVAYLRSLE